jgi:hypothetical protein
MSLPFYVPLQSISINRDGPVDALELFQQTGIAVLFTPGEVEHLVTEHGSLDGWLRQPTAEESPVPMIAEGGSPETLL